MAKSEGGGGGKQGLLLVLLIGLVALCGWNYQRNLKAEQSTPSPYTSLEDADVERLLAAYQGEVERLKAKQPSRAKVRSTPHIQAGANEFERVTRRSQTVREAGYELAEMEGMVKALEAEKAKRTALGGSPTQVFLRRAFSF